MTTAEAMADAAAARRGCRPSAGARRVDRRDRRVARSRSASRDGIAAAATALARDGGAAAARAIMTTDPFPKEAAVEVTTPAGRFRVGGIAKGSGHDRAADGDDARRRDDRRADRAGAAAARADGA